MTKEEWVTSYTTGRYEKCDRDVINFIADILFYQPVNDNIYNLFASGYCYYFAVMLKTAFDRGEICWHRCHGHIVWLDTDGTAYDIGGVVDDYNEGDLLPADLSLGSMLSNFKHNGSTFTSGSKEFSEWVEQCGMTDIYAIADIYNMMPDEERNDLLSVTHNALLYWAAHKQELSKYYTS